MQVMQPHSISTDPAKFIESLPAEKKLLLALRNPLSFAQQRLWFIDKLMPANWLYNVPLALRLVGPVDLAALCASLNCIINRHEALRASFHSVEGRPFQLIAPRLSVKVEEIDLTELGEIEASREAHKLAVNETKIGFDLKKAPLLRAKLIRIAEQEAVFTLTLHHIVSDGWSLNVLIGELRQNYEAAISGRQPYQQELEIQYSDYARWQRQTLKGDTLNEQMNYWKTTLEGAPAALELLKEGARQEIGKQEGGRVSVEIGPQTRRQIEQLSRNEAVTTFMTLLAAFQAMLSRVSGQQDILVGTPVAGRNRIETEKLIGLFINTLVMRTQVNGEQSFRSLLSSAQRSAIGAYANQDIPFEKLVEEIRPERSLNSSPLIQIMFDMQKAPEQWIDMADVRATTLELGQGAPHFDLTVTVIEEKESLRAIFDYRKDLFQPQTVSRMARYFANLVKAAAEDPDCPVADLPMIDDEELGLLLDKWNDTRRPASETACIHHLFERQVELRPDGVALICEDQEITYRELNRRANILAHRLQRLGVGPESPVVLLFERSIEMIVGMFAALKAGGAYIPVDPATPKDRVAFIISDIGEKPSPIILTQQSLVERLPEGANNVICLDSDLEQPAQSDSSNPVSGAGKNNLAYVIYTSGSTGKPKGAMVEHQALVNYIEIACERFEMQPGERFLQFVSISFDASAEDIFATLTRGATLVIRADSTPLSASAFLRWCGEFKISVFDFPTAYWHELMIEASANDWLQLEQLRLVVVGGEKARLEAAKTWAEGPTSRARFLNAYGPTEATIAATIYELPDAARIASMSGIPIGRPVANARTYALDTRLRPVPIGSGGELFIAGEGLARGYLNRAELTAERFLPDPFSRVPGSRMYRSGDKVRYLNDGNIDYLGRVDQQVKLRGFRIELGEIEHALLQHEAVAEAAVILKESQSKEPRLVAYLVTKDGHQATGKQLRSYLREKLPEYMAPAEYVTLERMPLTASGKVDRRSLPEVEQSQQATGEYIGPQTDMEEKLAKIWAEALKVERVSVEENLFDIGVHSLLAVKVAERIGRAVEREISLVKLFEHPTIRSLAAHLQEGDKEEKARQEQSELWANRRKQALKQRRQMVRSLS